jgi:hypothetical protein
MTIREEGRSVRWFAVRHRRIVLSHKGRHFRAFTQECQDSCFHPWTRRIRAFTQRVQRVNLIVSLHMKIRVFTQNALCLHTGSNKNPRAATRG